MTNLWNKSTALIALFHEPVFNLLHGCHTTRKIGNMNVQCSNVFKQGIYLQHRNVLNFLNFKDCCQVVVEY